MPEEAIDMKDVLERVQDDRELLLELFEIFVEDYSDKRKVLDDVMAKGEFDQIRDLVHSMKGAAGNISAKAMHNTCAQMEQLAEQSNLEEIKKLAPVLDEQFTALQAYIAKVKKDFQG